MYYFIAQLIGFIGAGFIILSYQCKSSRKLIGMQIFAHSLYVLHYFMLGALSGAINLVISIFRNFTVYNSNKKWAQYKFWIWFYVYLHIIATILTWQNVFNIFPCIAMVAMTLAAWTKNGKKIRIINLFVCSPSWLIYNFYTVSYSGILCELFNLFSVVVSFKRYGMAVLDIEE